ncbi:amino acid ABC transporter ATP-binding protein [Streptosporangium sp. NPDC006007]|uniref:amino acid ABC transporter ATP-binding protein n=1 Tax=Streptosporangium sp. NPDC006007 TaxID=3154575 RepID=UPI0033BD8D40
MAYVEIRDLYKSYGGTPVLSGLSLDIDEHEVVCLIGPSGCGKSTLLRCLNALEPIDGGHILVEGQDIWADDGDADQLRMRVGIVFQQYNLFPHMNVLDNITLAPRRVLGMRRREAENVARELLARVRLEDKATEHPDRLSGGQQQRIAIARALAMQPRVLLLDEVTSALDPEIVGEVLELIGELAADGMTLALATHEMSFAREVADRIVFLSEGNIVEQGAPERILSAPEDERTRQFLRRVLTARPGVVPAGP